MTGAEVFLFGLFELVGVETDPTAFIEDLVDFAGPFGPFKIMDDHMSLVPEKTLATLGMG